MYAFKVMVSTLIILLMMVVLYSGVVSSSKQGKTLAGIIFAINLLSLCAIWG